MYYWTKLSIATVDLFWLALYALLCLLEFKKFCLNKQKTVQNYDWIYHEIDTLQLFEP